MRLYQPSIPIKDYPTNILRLRPLHTYVLGKADPVKPAKESNFETAFTSFSGIDIKVKAGKNIVLSNLQSVGWVVLAGTDGEQLNYPAKVFGTMVFVCFDKSCMLSVPDDPFDLVFVGENEYGKQFKMAIGGVRPTSLSMGFSIDDIQMEETVTFEAKSFIPMTPIDTKE